MKNHRIVLLIIVVAQFCCTSLWFAGNAVMSDIVIAFDLSESALAHLTSAVQFGFITGTLVFAMLTIADRFSPSKVFFVCALIGGIFNLGTIWQGNSFWSLIAFRFVTGFCLAGIYPVGMKIAADYFQKGLGKSLGFLVGALVIGTAFPHLLNSFSGALLWKMVLITTSSIAILGGLVLVLFVPNGPHRQSSTGLDLTALVKVFQNKKFKSAAFGYFGHMWELYTFWAFVPTILLIFTKNNPTVSLNIPLLSFLIIGLGGVSCVIGGYISEKKGTQKTAMLALSLSGLSCLIAPLILNGNSSILLVGFLIFWGLMVITDSPLFSTLVAQNANPAIKGTALTIVNCIGFSITIISIQCVNWAFPFLGNYVFMLLAIGPIFGLMALRGSD
jgi:MFS family permease